MFNVCKKYLKLNSPPLWVSNIGIIIIDALEDGNISIPSDAWHSQQKHIDIAMLEELILFVEVCGDVQIPHSQRHEGVNLG